jgi:hypothetical protein
MGASPDVMFQFAFSISLSADAIAGIAKSVQDSVFTPSTVDYFRKQNILPLPPQTSYGNGVLSVGLWIGAEQGQGGKWVEDAVTDAQRLQALMSSGFISGGQTVGFLFSRAMMELRGKADLTAKPTSGIHPDSLKVNLSSTEVVTIVKGTYDVPVLPDIDFTYTVHEALSLNPQGASPPLAARAISHNLDVSQLGIIADSILIGLVENGLGGIALIGEEIAAGTRDPHDPGVGASLAAAWPASSLISKPIVGKITFLWTHMTMDATAIRTTGHLQIGLRSPQVKIVGPTAVSFRRTQASATETYSVALTDLRPENARVVWGGAAQGSGPRTQVRFDVAGTFRITATVTDTDNVSATGATAVGVTITKVGDGRTGETP